MKPLSKIRNNDIVSTHDNQTFAIAKLFKIVVDKNISLPKFNVRTVVFKFRNYILEKHINRS